MVANPSIQQIERDKFTKQRITLTSKEREWGTVYDDVGLSLPVTWLEGGEELLLLFFVSAIQNTKSKQPAKHEIRLKTCLQHWFENTYQTRFFFKNNFRSILKVYLEIL